MGVAVGIARENRKRVRPRIVEALHQYEMSVRAIAKQWSVGTSFVNKVALEEGIDLMNRKNVVDSYKKTGVLSPTYKYQPDYYGTWVQESMTGDGSSLEWLSKKW